MGFHSIKNRLLEWVLPKMCDRITSPLKIGRVCVASHGAVLVIPGFGLRTTLEINSKFKNGSMNGRKYCEGEYIH